MIRRIINRIKQIYYRSSNERFISFLRTKGVEIGEGTMMRPKSTNIDLTRPSLISIGKNCYMNENFTLLTHDWVTRVFIRCGLDFLPISGRVTIGNNVSFGQNVIVLKGVAIGDNSFIGAGSIVTKDIPSNSFAVGIPCKVVATIEDYYKKRLSLYEAEALDYARSIKERLAECLFLQIFMKNSPYSLADMRLKNIRKYLSGGNWDPYMILMCVIIKRNIILLMNL